MDKDLLEAYRRTTFLADTPNARLALRIGQRSAELDDLLVAQRVTTWAYVTAFNLGSRLLPVDDNVQRHGELERQVAALGFESYPGEGIGDDGRWPPESSLLVLGVGRADAVRLGQRFGQLAVVYGELGQEAESSFAIGNARSRSAAGARRCVRGIGQTTRLVARLQLCHSRSGRVTARGSSRCSDVRKPDDAGVVP